jgi:hypothetical protein
MRIEVAMVRKMGNCGTISWEKRLRGSGAFAKGVSLGGGPSHLSATQPGWGRASVSASGFPPTEQNPKIPGTISGKMRQRAR